MPDDALPVAHCRDCGAAVAPQARACWLCGAAIEPHDAAIDAKLLGLPPPPGPLRMTFSISGLLTVTTLAALCLGVGLIWPGLGIGLVIVILPALVRTWLITARAGSVQVKPVERFAAFVGSLAVSLITMTTVSVAAAAAFMGSCIVAAAGSEALRVARGYDVWPIAVGAGALGGLVAGIGVVLLMRPLWKIRP